MIKRTIEISANPSHLTVRDGQLLILRRTEPSARLPANPPNLAGSVPLEDVGIVVVDERETTYSHHALAALMEAGAAVVICGRTHQPSGFLLPYPTHHEVVWRIDRQVRIGKVQRKQLWTQIVQAKVRAQAAVLDHDEAAQSKLVALARSVRSGDPENIESQAARVYWGKWLTGEDTERLRQLSTTAFRREPGGSSVLNDLLDYGYAIFRAAVARAVVSAGMLPAIGLKHSSRGNAFCLADDLLEPLRPAVDARVRKLLRLGWVKLERTPKAELLTLLTVRASTRAKSDGDAGADGSPLMVALHRYVSSLAECLERGSGELDVPMVDPREAETHRGDCREAGGGARAAAKGANDLQAAPGRDAAPARGRKSAPRRAACSEELFVKDPEQRDDER